MTSPGAEERGGGWRGGPPGGGPPGAAGGLRGPPPPGRWGGPEDERPGPRSGGWGGGPGRTSLDEMPRRPPPGMGHEDKWGGGGGGGRAPWENDRDHRGGGGDHHREWGGRRDYGGGGGGGGGQSHWEHDPAWMHDGQQAGDGPASSARGPPPPTARQAMTAKDIERERQEMQAQWRAEQANKVRGGTGREGCGGCATQGGWLAQGQAVFNSWIVKGLSRPTR